MFCSTINNNRPFMLQWTTVIMSNSYVLNEGLVFPLSNRKKRIKLYKYHNVYFAAVSFRSVP